MTSPGSTISEERLGLYYLGMALSVIGLILFFSVFVSGCRSLGGHGSDPSSVVWVPAGQDPSIVKSACGPLGIDCNAEVRTYTGNNPPSPSGWGSPSPSNGSSEFGRALTGMILIVAGGILMNLGKSGLRGSGAILDPQGARDDLKPWNVARGGMIDDTLRASEVITGMVERTSAPTPREPSTIKVRCPKCRTLNDEDAHFCKSCAAPL